MKAFVMKEIGSVGFMEKPLPGPGPNDAIVKTRAALICGSDSHTRLCPVGRLRMERLLRILETKRVDPALMTSDTFHFDEMERAFAIADKKLEDVVKVLITF